MPMAHPVYNWTCQHLMPQVLRMHVPSVANVLFSCDPAAHARCTHLNSKLQQSQTTLEWWLHLWLPPLPQPVVHQPPVTPGTSCHPSCIGCDLLRPHRGLKLTRRPTPTPFRNLQDFEEFQNLDKVQAVSLAKEEGSGFPLLECPQKVGISQSQQRECLDT